MLTIYFGLFILKSNMKVKQGHRKVLLKNCSPSFDTIWLLGDSHTSGAVQLIGAIPAVYDAITPLLKWKTGSTVATVEMGCQIACCNSITRFKLPILIQHT
jgi:hypothetical protein